MKTTLSAATDKSWTTLVIPKRADDPPTLPVLYVDGENTLALAIEAVLRQSEVKK